MNKMSFGAVLAVVSVLLAGCQTAPSTGAAAKPKATVAAPAATTSTSRAIPCGHPVDETPILTAEEEFFPKGAPARSFANNFALVRTMDGHVGLNPLLPAYPSSTEQPADNGQPFNITVTKAVGNAVTITVPKNLAPYTGTPIDGIDSSPASVAKAQSANVEAPDSHALGPISTMQLGEVRHAVPSSVFADENGCYYLDTRDNSWRGVAYPVEVVITRIAAGYNVVSVIAKWRVVYPATIKKAQDIAASPDQSQAAPQPAALPLPELPDCPNQYAYRIVPLTGKLLPGSPACVMVGISYRNLKRTTVTLAVHTPSCGPQPPVATAILQGTGSKTLLVIEPCGDLDASYSLSYSRSVPKEDIRIQAATELTD